MGPREGREVPRKRLWGSGTRLTEGHSQGGSEAPFLLCKVETMHTHTSWRFWGQRRKST